MLSASLSRESRPEPKEEEEGWAMDPPLGVRWWSVLRRKLVPPLGFCWCLGLPPSCRLPRAASRARPSFCPSFLPWRRAVPTECMTPVPPRSGSYTVEPPSRNSTTSWLDRRVGSWVRHFMYRSRATTRCSTSSSSDRKSMDESPREMTLEADPATASYVSRRAGRSRSRRCSETKFRNRREICRETTLVGDWKEPGFSCSSRVIVTR